MNELLPFGFADSPRHLFRGSPMTRIQEKLDLAAEKGSVPATLLARMAWRPLVFGKFIKDHPACRAAAVAAIRRPVQAIGVVAKYPEMLPELRSLILSDPETAEELAALEEVLPALAEICPPSECLKAVGDDPNRRLRILNRAGSAALQGEMAVVNGQVQEKRLTSAAWAYAWLCRNAPSEEVPLDEGLVKILLTEESYACLAMRMLRDKVFPPIVWEGLSRGIKSPRWAYYALINSLVVGPERQRCMDLLHRDPAWLVEYLSERDVAFPEGKKSYTRCVKEAAGHELLTDLHEWFLTATVVIGSR